LYFIDHLALRVGGKKDSKEQADTVGVTSLRVEHITFLENNIIKLDFLGKDSIRYCRKIEVNPIIYKNLQEFTKDKTKKDELFELITSASLNEYLDSFMEGLTAKVWRTFNASLIFQKELDKLTSNKKLELYTERDEKINYLLMLFNQANTAVALLCNHQKASNTNIENTLKKIDEKIKKLKKRRTKYKQNTDKYNEIKKKIELLKIKKESKIKMKNVSLGTSIQNYIDPRIIYAFIKKYDIPEEKVFTGKSKSRFKWASLVNTDYRF
jgi:DNA topoisomerase-1